MVWTYHGDVGGDFVGLLFILRFPLLLQLHVALAVRLLVQVDQIAERLQHLEHVHQTLVVLRRHADRLSEAQCVRLSAQLFPRGTVALRIRVGEDAFRLRVME